MHNPAVPHPRATGLFEKLRRASLLRALLVFATLLVSQNALACEIEDVLAATDVALPADFEASSSTDGAGDDCCMLCLDCAQCGGCHGSAIGARLGHVDSALQGACIKFTFATAAPSLWTPPALLRPPIDLA